MSRYTKYTQGPLEKYWMVEERILIQFENKKLRLIDLDSLAGLKDEGHPELLELTKKELMKEIETLSKHTAYLLANI